ncbi:MAG: endolytic transglycosylase MltG [Rhodanobacteraceae bacterium]|nr:MAG: endolytic transglycosylase MltG [Rhodanobacteraceae bacterium]
MRVGARGQGGRVAVVQVLLWLIVLVVAVAVAWAGITYRHFTHTPLTVTRAGQTVEIAKGTGFNGIVGQLHADGVTRAPRVLWQVLAWRLRVVSKLHAGEYALVPGMLPVTLLQNMAAGRVLHRRVTLVDGWTFTQVRQALERAPKLAHALRGLPDDAVMARLGVKELAPEGEFMPDTYDYVLGMSDLDVLRRAHAAMQAFLATQWAQRDPSIPLQQPYQALILASLVEKETAVPSELPRVAGVFERRLKIGMRLDTDPSVIYGMGGAYAGTLHKADLETDTPYNTYMRNGLPPTPIALPSRAAIRAVLHPASGNALYFVAKGDGTHQFSATLAEQNAAVKKYILDKTHNR